MLKFKILYQTFRNCMAYIELKNWASEVLHTELQFISVSVLLIIPAVSSLLWHSPNLEKRAQIHVRFPSNATSISSDHMLVQCVWNKIYIY